MKKTVKMKAIINLGTENQPLTTASWFIMMILNVSEF